MSNRRTPGTWRNVGGIDRAARLVVGIVLLPIGLFLLIGGHGGLAITAAGVVMLATGITRFCPLYIPFGISTVRAKVKETGASPAPYESQLPGRAEGGSGL